MRASPPRHGPAAPDGAEPAKLAWSPGRANSSKLQAARYFCGWRRLAPPGWRAGPAGSTRLGGHSLISAVFLSNPKQCEHQAARSSLAARPPAPALAGPGPPAVPTPPRPSGAESAARALQGGRLAQPGCGWPRARSSHWPGNVCARRPGLRSCACHRFCAIGPVRPCRDYP